MPAFSLILNTHRWLPYTLLYFKHNNTVRNLSLFTTHDQHTNVVHTHLFTVPGEHTKNHIYLLYTKIQCSTYNSCGMRRKKGKMLFMEKPVRQANNSIFLFSYAGRLVPNSVTSRETGSVSLGENSTPCLLTATKNTRKQDHK